MKVTVCLMDCRTRLCIGWTQNGKRYAKGLRLPFNVPYIGEMDFGRQVGISWWWHDKHRFITFPLRIKGK